MARISKNLVLSGKVGNLVFATNGNKSYVRSLPGQVKQTLNTKKAASRFGLCSEKDKNYRLLLQNTYTLYTDSRYAARHRAQLLKTSTTTGQAPATALAFTTPQPLLGFCFNQQLPWDKVVRFYPTFALHAQGVFTIQIPEIQWGQHLRPQKNTQQIRITFHAFVVNLNLSPIILEKVTDIELLLHKNQNLPAQNTTYTLTQTHGWVLVLATVVLENKEGVQPATYIGTSSYVFAATCGSEG